MKDLGKALLSLLAIAVASTGLAFAIKKILEEQPRGIFSLVPVRHKDILTLTDIVNYFRGLSLNKSKDTPFVCIEPGRFNIKAATNPDLDEHVLLVGVYAESINNMRNSIFVYSHQYDDALKNVLSKAKDGIVTLS